jgi:hypothetical protein
MVTAACDEELHAALGRNMQTGGEYAMAAGAVGTVVPVLGETGIPEGVAAGGGASWLIGKGIEGVGSWFNRN